MFDFTNKKKIEKIYSVVVEYVTRQFSKNKLYLAILPPRTQGITATQIYIFDQYTDVCTPMPVAYCPVAKLSKHLKTRDNIGNKSTVIAV